MATQPNQFEQYWADGPAAQSLAVFGEDVVFTPKGGPGVTIKAEIIRNSLGLRSTDQGKRLEYAREAWVRREDVPTLTLQGDTLACKKRITDTSNTTFPVTALLEETAGMWRLKLGA